MPAVGTGAVPGLAHSGQLRQRNTTKETANLHQLHAGLDLQFLVLVQGYECEDGSRVGLGILHLSRQVSAGRHSVCGRAAVK